MKVTLEGRLGYDKHQRVIVDFDDDEKKAIELFYKTPFGSHIEKTNDSQVIDDLANIKKYKSDGWGVFVTKELYLQSMNDSCYRNPLQFANGQMQLCIRATELLAGRFSLRAVGRQRLKKPLASHLKEIMRFIRTVGSQSSKTLLKKHVFELPTIENPALDKLLIPGQIIDKDTLLTFLALGANVNVSIKDENGKTYKIETK